MKELEKYYFFFSFRTFRFDLYWHECKSVLQTWMLEIAQSQFQTAYSFRIIWICKSCCIRNSHSLQKGMVWQEGCNYPKQTTKWTSTHSK